MAKPGVIAAFEQRPNPSRGRAMADLIERGRIGIVDSQALTLSVDEISATPLPALGHVLASSVETAVTATYVYKFGPYVEWPATSFSTIRLVAKSGYSGDDDRTPAVDVRRVRAWFLLRVRIMDPNQQHEPATRMQLHILEMESWLRGVQAADAVARIQRARQALMTLGVYVADLRRSGTERVRSLA
jgi:hypothetical protein